MHFPTILSPTGTHPRYPPQGPTVVIMLSSGLLASPDSNTRPSLIASGHHPQKICCLVAVAAAHVVHMIALVFGPNGGGADREGGSF